MPALSIPAFRCPPNKTTLPAVLLAGRAVRMCSC